MFLLRSQLLPLLDLHRSVKSSSTMRGVSVIRILWLCCLFHNRSVKSCSTISGVSVLRIIWSIEQPLMYCLCNIVLLWLLEVSSSSVANTYSIQILLETYLSRSTRYHDLILHQLAKISACIFQWKPKLSFKLYWIQLPIIKAISMLLCLDENSSYLSSYIQFNAKSTSRDLRTFVSTRTKALFQAYYTSDNVIKSQVSIN